MIVYLTDPPTSGNHYPDPQDGGFFDHEIAALPRSTPMEHGAVIIYYNPATLTRRSAERAESAGAGPLRVVLADHLRPADDATYPIILTAWTHRLRLTTYDEPGSDRHFVTFLYLGNGPEHDPDERRRPHRRLALHLEDDVLEARPFLGSTSLAAVVDAVRADASRASTGHPFSPLRIILPKGSSTSRNSPVALIVAATRNSRKWAMGH